MVRSTDDTFVVRVTASWPTVGSIEAGAAVLNGENGVIRFGPFDLGPNENGAAESFEVPVSLVAIDSYGNQSSPYVLTVTVEYSFN